MSPIKYRPGEDVRNLFTKKHQSLKPTSESTAAYEKTMRMAKQRKKLFEFEGRYDDVDYDEVKLPAKKGSPQKKGTLAAITAREIDSSEEDNSKDQRSLDVQNAIKIRLLKQRHSDFFIKLHQLKEKIEVYNEVFRPDVGIQKRKA
jgi:hypothetical protein